MYHRPINTIRSLLVHPKDKTPDLQKLGVAYQITCPQCQHLYVGETGRTLATSMKDHISHNSQPTVAGDHCRDHGHVINKNNVEVLAREEACLNGMSAGFERRTTLSPVLRSTPAYIACVLYKLVRP